MPSANCRSDSSVKDAIYTDATSELDSLRGAGSIPVTHQQVARRWLKPANRQAARHKVLTLGDVHPKSRLYIGAAHAQQTRGLFDGRIGEDTLTEHQLRGQAGPLARR